MSLKLRMPGARTRLGLPACLLAAGPGLITDYTGTPTAYGAGYESHLKSLTGL
jgi:hypothetical protein